MGLCGCQAQGINIRFGQLRNLKNKSKWRLATVVVTSSVFLAALGVLGYAVSGAFTSMASTADEIDDTRAVTAARGALKALKKQLGATVRDNAYWDDAFKKMTSPEAGEWAIDNWGSTTADYPLYDTAMVIKPDGMPLMAFHKGVAVTDPSSFYLGHLAKLLDIARRPDPTRDGLPVAFIRTADGIAIIGAAAIQPSAYDSAVDSKSLDVLVFSKQLTPKVVAEISTTFTIDGLELVEGAAPQKVLSAEVSNIGGTRIAYLTWPHLDPGTEGYLQVRPIIVKAGAGLLLLLAGVGMAGFSAFRTIKKDERLADHKATHDALTGLWNRAGCLEQIDVALEAHPRNTSLSMLDLDGFKPVNDAWGHAVGDELIRAVARRLMENLPRAAVIARLGGDEFAIVTTPMGGANPIPEKILACLKEPFMIDGRTIEIGGSVGTADSTREAIDASELLRRADLALYCAKDAGRGIGVTYDRSLDEDAGRLAELEQDLRHALSIGEIYVAYQPLIDAASREIRGIEALARWQRPNGEHVSPDVFIRVAEKAGLIDSLGLHVLRTSLGHASQWPDIGVAVNVSPLQLRNPYFASQVAAIIESAGFDPKRLTFEVTEGVLISNPNQAKRAFSALRQLGIKIALDDFGSGFASIGALREFGFDRMKIDRSLIVALDHGDRNGAVLQATIALANALSLPVTAEGIETEEQAAVVRLSGCDELQGYLFSRPISADEITIAYFGPASQVLAG